MEFPSASSAADARGSLPQWRARTWALVVIACVLVMDILDLTIVNVAVPTLQTRFGAGETAVQWMVAGYATVFAILLVTGGRLGDIVGYRRMLIGGMGGFVLASALCGFAPDPQWLVAARLVQGITAAMMLPQIMSLVQILYPPRERIAALGVFGILGGTAAVAGPLIGGLLIGANLFGLGWRAIFLVNLPVGLATMAAAGVLLPAGGSLHRPRLDVTGTLLVTMTLAAVMVPLVEGRALGWPAWCIVLLCCAFPLAAVLIAYSRRRMARDGSAAIIPDLFHQRSFSLGFVMITLYQAAIAGLLFTLTQMLQQGLGFSAMQVGVAHVPFAIGSAIGIGLLARKVLPRIGPGLLVAGAGLMAAALILLVVQIAAGWASVSGLFPVMFALGLGMGMLSGPLSQITLSEVDVGHAGGASGMMKSTQELGGAIGVALIGGLFYSLRDRPGAATTEHAFMVTAVLIAGLILTVGALALRVPRSLPIFAPRTAEPAK